MNQQPIKNYRVLAIVSIFISLIFGLIALNYSWQVDKALRAGDLALAQKYSRTTRIWIIVSFVILGLVILGQVAAGLANPR